jgi:AcrR family transcriptional regulator
MTGETGEGPRLPRRRVPQQQRSRGRVERVLEAADRLVVSGGVEPLNTRMIAKAAGIPVASLYQYFAGKEAILLALAERDLEAMNEQMAADLATLSTLTVRAMAETVVRAMVTVYRRRPSLVMIYVRGRTIPAVRDFCRLRNRQVARELFEAARRAGMVREPSNVLWAELAMEIIDRLFQIAFESSLEGDPEIVEEAIVAVTSYLETHATTAGITGVPVSRG